MTPGSEDTTIAIVGGGECAAGAAVRLRDRGFAGRVVLIGAETDEPYERPPVSKSALKPGADTVTTTVLSQAAAAGRAIDMRLGDPVTTIDRSNQTLSLASGQSVGYDRLLLATGARARTLAVPGAELASTLRTIADARRLASALRDGASVVVIGAGFIGLEVAAAARGRGCLVTVVEVGDRALARAVPETLADLLVKRHIAEHVDFRFGVQVGAIERANGALVVHLAQGSDTIIADVVIAGVGALPNIDLAETSDLVVDNGVAVDGHLATSDPAIFAAGDCCSAPHPLFGGARVRLESWRAARDQALIAAANLVGGDEIYDTVPSFWSDQYELTLQIAGLPSFATHEVVREHRDGTALHFGLDAAGRLVSVAAVAPPEAVAVFKSLRFAERLIAGRARPDPTELADSTIAVRSLSLG